MIKIHVIQVTRFRDPNLDICIADGKAALAKVIPMDGVGLQEVKKDGLNSYSVKECDKIDVEMVNLL